MQFLVSAVRMRLKQGIVEGMPPDFGFGSAHAVRAIADVKRSIPSPEKFRTVLVLKRPTMASEIAISQSVEEHHAMSHWAAPKEPQDIAADVFQRRPMNRPTSS